MGRIIDDLKGTFDDYFGFEALEDEARFTPEKPDLDNFPCKIPADIPESEFIEFHFKGVGEVYEDDRGTFIGIKFHLDPEELPEQVRRSDLYYEEERELICVHRLEGDTSPAEVLDYDHIRKVRDHEACFSINASRGPYRDWLTVDSGVDV